MKRLMVLLTAIVALATATGCGVLGSPTDWVWNMPRPCTIFYSTFGAGEEAPPYVAKVLLGDTVALKALAAWAETAGLTPEQLEGLTQVLVADAANDRWVWKHIADIVKQMWWRGEKDDEWLRRGYQNGKSLKGWWVWWPWATRR